MTNLQSYGVIRSTRKQERQVAERLVSELRPDDTFWDVGTNIGVYACLASDVVEDGTVVGFEPYPPNVTTAERNVAINDADVTIREVALAAEAGSTRFHVLDTDTEGTHEGTIDPTYARVDDEVASISVQKARGDVLVANGVVPPPDVVKMDVEGAGPAAIRGMRETIERNTRVLVVEPHDNYSRLRDLLTDLGFELEHVDRGSDPSPTIFAYASDADTRDADASYADTRDADASYADASGATARDRVAGATR